MPIIYVDNFRGFKDTFIPLKDVNFFVGENSTGKTSILSLIKLLSDPTFWFSFDFNNDVDLGYFKEIASQNKNNVKSFCLGFFNETTENDTIDKCVFVKFKNHNDSPLISEFNYINNNLDIRIILTKNKLKYKVIEFDQELSNILSPTDFFKNWIDSIKHSKNTGFKYSKERVEGSIRRSVPFIKTIVEEEINLVKKDIEFESSIPIFIEKLSWTAPIRAKPRRIYENYAVHYSPEGEHSPHILKAILKSKKTESKELISKYLIPFGQHSGLFKKINVSNYGKNQMSPYSINVMLNDQEFKISNVGYGVSQVLPIMTDMIALTEKTWLLIQQPEVHLHPKAQAALGEFICNIHVHENKKFIIETHSEYLINRFRIKLNENKEKKINSQVVFFERTSVGNSIHIIDIHEDGKYSEDQPASFSDFFILEELKLLEI